MERRTLRPRRTLRHSSSQTNRLCQCLLCGALRRAPRPLPSWLHFFLRTTRVCFLCLCDACALTHLMLCVRAPHVLHCRYWRGRKASASTEIDGAKIDDARWAALRKGWMREQGYDPDTGDAADAAPDDDDEDVRLMREMEEEEERRQEEERIAFLAERAKKQQAAESAKAKASSRIPASPFCNHAHVRACAFSAALHQSISICSCSHFDLHLSCIDCGCRRQPTLLKGVAAAVRVTTVTTTRTFPRTRVTGLRICRHRKRPKLHVRSRRDSSGRRKRRRQQQKHSEIATVAAATHSRVDRRAHCCTTQWVRFLLQQTHKEANASTY
jgi:hypothetical protein